MRWRFKKDNRTANAPRSGRLPTSGQRPTTFQYSSNRMGTERGFDRGGADRTAAHIHKLRRQLMTIPYAVGLLCLVLGVLYLSTLGSSPQLIISGDQQLLRDKTAYQTAAEALLKSKLQYRSKISFDGQELAAQLQNSFPELKIIDVSTPLLRHRPVIELAVAAPAVVFVSGNNSYLLDERGVALFDLKQTDHKVDTASLPVLSDQANFQVEVNKPALSSSQVDFIYEVTHQITAKQLKITSMTLESGGGELDVRLKDVPYKVKFNFYEDARKSSGAFLAAKEQIERDGAQPTEYVDVRIPTRAYIR